MISGGLAALGVRRMQRLSAFFTVGLGVGLANFVVITAFHIQEQDYSKLALYFGLSMLNGVLCALLTMSTFYLLSHLFRITTTLQLLELLDPTQPLMQRLMTEAPGTYHHSMVVANLAERAAQMIDANPLLARVSAYYHDVGKLTRPYFFIENQIDRRNLHDELDPYTSAQIIIGHVSDGLALAKEHGLPARVCDVIAQHHGTHLVQYFYAKAQKLANGQLVDEACFRYPGPIPQTGEGAIVMLADSVEATVRASRDHDAQAIDTIVRKIIGERIAAGQLDGCDLTMRNMEQIRVAFTSMLQGIFHPRIEYPPANEPTVAPVPVESNLSVDLEYPQIQIEV
jgi:putative nucleotidyltransferase with HDIG domain